MSRHDLVTGKELARIELPFTPGVVGANEVTAIYSAIDGGGATVTADAVWYAEAQGRKLYRIPLT